MSRLYDREEDLQLLYFRRTEEDAKDFGRASRGWAGPRVPFCGPFLKLNLKILLLILVLFLLISI